MNEISVASKYDFKCLKVQDSENLLDIKPYHEELEKSRAEDVKSVLKSVTEVRKDLESLKTDVLNLKENQTDYLRRKMFDLENKISTFKEAIKEELLLLLKEERTLKGELQFIEKRLEDWGKPISFKIFKPFKQTGSKVRKLNDNSTSEFQKFLLSSGGRYGGWEEQDHLLFLKERSKYKKKEKFISSLHCLLPDLSYELIEEHEKWYEKYETLRNSQKEEIKKWKMEKDLRKKKEEKKECAEEKKQIKKGVQQQINIAQRIQEWKKQQSLKKQEQEEREKLEKEKLKEEEKRKKELQQLKRLAVNQYKAEKMNKIQENFLNDDRNKALTQEEKHKNNVLLKSFRVQDLKFIEKKKVIRLQIESKANERLEKLRLAKPALEIILQRDPQRIFQPTVIWSQHCLESQKREKVNPVFDLNSIPRLAIPEWRKELK